jgi:hypothetical protein
MWTLAIATLAAVGVMTAGTPAGAAPARPAVHHFQNCTDMHRVYKGGVKRKGAHDHRTSGGHARYAPYVSTRLYNANSQMDRDRDGVACEQ